MAQRHDGENFDTGGGRRSRKRGSWAHSRFWTGLVWGVILFLVLYVFPMPFFIFKAGTAEEVGPMVHTKTQAHPEQGQFLLTTVGVSNSNIMGLLLAKLKDEQIRRKADVLGDNRNMNEYSQRQEFNMMSSQSNAIQAAYKKAGVPFSIQSDGIVVLQVQKEMPAAAVLQAGDVITEADGKPVLQPTDLTSYVKGKQEGDTIALTFKRKNETKQGTVALGVIPAPSPSPGSTGGGTTPAKKIGIGITLGGMQSVRPQDESKQVTVSAGDIGGPSAGLMFSLEIFNKLTPEDITKGYRVAGTGEIDPEGNVGVIGGIKFKVRAASREHAEIFFAPADWAPPGGTTIPNYSEAVQEAQKLKTSMKIVSVKTMQDALDYLNKLPPKQAKPAA